MTEKDLFGQALYDYWTNKAPEDMITWTHLTEQEILPVAYLFRNIEQMPKSEQVAMKNAFGKILDVGAGSGCHTLHLQEKNKPVTALELSATSCKLMKARGVKNIVHQDFFSYQPKQLFDTILFLMNGVGIVKKAKYLNRLFEKIDDLLDSSGQALIHSSDIKYLYETAGGYQMPENEYYGDIRFFIRYKGKTESFDWTYIDENTLRIFAKQKGFKTEKLHQSDEGDFLLKIKRM